MSSLLDDAFILLEAANRLEENERNEQYRIEASTKYYEGIYLLKRYLTTLPWDSCHDQRNLIQKKIKQYEVRASALLNGIDANNTPRSPLGGSGGGVGAGVGGGGGGVQRHHSPSFEDSPSGWVMVPGNPPISGSQLRNVLDLAGRANSQFERALDLDESNRKPEAIREYMAAAELYLKAIKLYTGNNGPDDSSTSILKRRMEGILDRVEQLRRVPVAIASRSPAVKELHNETRLRDNQHHNGKRMIKIKEKESSKGNLSEEEVAVLKRSSLIASGVFLPWSDEDAQILSNEATRPMKASFVDPHGPLKLSEKQKKRFHGWARPSEINRMRGGRDQLVMLRSISPYTIRQQYVTDCSFIASLCICAAFERRFRKRLVTSIIYPQSEDGIPIYNPSGKYMVKLWLNGVARQVVIDDLLPVDRNGNMLCSQTNNDTELWVSIIEKAYMKLCGGYSFPGSNSGIDMYSLTGWIPERLFFPKDQNKVRDFETPVERAWERLYSASSFGDCLITVSTGNELKSSVAEKMGLVTGHAYAVLSVVQTRNETRLLQLKNPWAHKAWKGRFSSQDTRSWSDSSLREEIGYDSNLAAQHDDGVFWICFEDLLTYFCNLHINWNPMLFQSRISTHSFWPASQGPAVDTFNVSDNPQYVITFSDSAIAKKSPIWILLSRHVTAQEQEGGDVTDFLTVHIHRSTSSNAKIWYPGSDSCIVTGAYTNNPHVLVRYDLTGGADRHLSLVLSQYQKANDLAYSLSCYCGETFSLSRPRKDPPRSTHISSRFTEATAGGPPGSKTFGNNPMWALHLPKHGRLQIRCSTEKTVAINVMVVAVASRGARVSCLTVEPALESKAYRHGFVAMESEDLPAGDYTLIVSTFNPGKLGPFELDILSSVVLPQPTPIPP